MGGFFCGGRTDGRRQHFLKACKKKEAPDRSQAGSGRASPPAGPPLFFFHPKCSISCDMHDADSAGWFFPLPPRLQAASPGCLLALPGDCMMPSPGLQLHVADCMFAGNRASSLKGHRHSPPRPVGFRSVTRAGREARRGSRTSASAQGAT